MMRRSDSISSISSMGSDAEETMRIFVKNVSGDSSKHLSVSLVPNLGTTGSLQTSLSGSFHMQY